MPRRLGQLSFLIWAPHTANPKQKRLPPPVHPGKPLTHSFIHSTNISCHVPSSALQVGGSLPSRAQCLVTKYPLRSTWASGKCQLNQSRGQAWRDLGREAGVTSPAFHGAMHRLTASAPSYGVTLRAWEGSRVTLNRAFTLGISGARGPVWTPSHGPLA